MLEHVVLLMQENRSFDHYFGTLSGVRGFGDPHAMRLPNGHSVFQQPDPSSPDGYLLPYRLNSRISAAQAIPSMSHEWTVQHQAWNNGAMDNWLPAHRAADGAKGPYTMGYFTREDIPFQYALADAFTICDAYHCSVFGPTHPNRYMWLTGTIDPNGESGGPALGNNAPSGTYSWKTYPERLTEAGVSWKFYHEPQSATGLPPIATGVEGGGLPIGPGFRVPLIIVSPWTVGGRVCSEPFDHTSQLRFLERITGVAETNISDFRRKNLGDLTSAFRFASASRHAPSLPDTSGPYNLAQYETSQLPMPSVPTGGQHLPRQEPGRRPRVPWGLSRSPRP